MNLREAYGRWNREQRALADFRRELRRIRLDVESIELDMAAEIARQKDSRASALAAELAECGRYRKTVDAFLNFRGYSKNRAGWRAACGTDVGLWRKTRGLDWPRLWRAVLESRKMRDRETRR